MQKSCVFNALKSNTIPSLETGSSGPCHRTEKSKKYWSRLGKISKSASLRQPTDYWRSSTSLILAYNTYLGIRVSEFRYACQNLKSLIPQKRLNPNNIFSVALSSLAPIFFCAAVDAQTFTVDKDGRLVEQAPLVTGNQTTVFFDRLGQPIRPIEDPTAKNSEQTDLPEKVVVASVARQPAQYSKHHPQVLQNIQMVARRYQRDPALRKVNLSPREWAAFFQAMIKVESNYNATARSHANAIGLAQIIPSTARYLRIDVNDPVQNLDGGARYLLEQIQDFGDVRLALAAYNAGPGAVQKYGGIPPYKETQNHVRRVMAEYARLLN